MVTEDARSVSTWNREKGLPLTELERVTLSSNYELDCNSSNVVYLLSCKVCHAQYVGSTTTIFRIVLERIQGFLLRVETRMILYMDIFLAPDTMVLRMSLYS